MTPARLDRAGAARGRQLPTSEQGERTQQYCYLEQKKHAEKQPKL